MSIYGSYEDMRDMMRAEAGDDRPRSHVFIPGEDFDPYDPDDVEAVKLVGEKDRADQVDYWKERALRAEQALAREDDEYEQEDFA